ncbi:MAG: polyprenyl diphosphate synthase, partial [Gemmatimonadota bacterium]
MSGLHVGIIMDGNGRWGLSRGMPRSAGHRAGARALREVVEAAPDAGVATLTVYAFSADNWRRPPEEVGLLLRLFRAYLRSERAACQRNGVRVSVLGRRDRLPQMLRREIALKTLSSMDVGDADRVQRLLHEARTAGALDHPAIVPIHDVGMHEGMPYFAMAYVRGQTLAQALKLDRLPGRRRRVEVVCTAAEAVAHAHA